MLKVVLASLFFYYISRTRTAYRLATWSTRLLYEYLCFIWKLTLKIHNECGRVIMTLDSGSGVRGFQPEVPAPSSTIFFSVPDIF